MGALAAAGAVVSAGADRRNLPMIEAWRGLAEGKLDHMVDDASYLIRRRTLV